MTTIRRPAAAGRSRAFAIVLLGAVAVVTPAGAQPPDPTTAATPSPEDEARWQQMLADVRAATADGRTEAAVDGAERAFLFADDTFGRNHQNTIAAAILLARAYQDAGRSGEAEPLLRGLVRMTEAALGPDHEQTLDMLARLAGAYEALNRPADAEPIYRRLLETRQRTLGAGHADTQSALNDLGLMLLRQGQATRAEPLLAGALAAIQSQHGADSVEAVPYMLNLATARSALGQVREAEALLLRAVAIAEANGRGDEPAALTAASSLAVGYQEQGRFAEAEPILLRVLETRRRLRGESHPETVMAAGNLAALYADMGRRAEAGVLLEQVLSDQERTLGPTHRDTLLAAMNLGTLRIAEGRYAEAEPLIVRTLEARERALGREHPETLTAVRSLAGLYTEQERVSEAVPLLLRAVEASERAYGPDHPDTLEALNSLAVGYAMQERFAEAEALLARVLETSERVNGPDHPDTLNRIGNLAGMRAALGRLDEAEALYRRAIETAEARLGADHPATLSYVHMLAGLHRRQRNFEAAEALYARALAGRTQRLGDRHPDVISAAFNVAEMRLLLPSPERALEPARIGVAASRARRAAAGGDLYAAAQAERDRHDRAYDFTLLADAAWAAVAARRDEAPVLAAEAFRVLQEASADPANQAVVRMAIRRFADQAAAGLGALVRERETLEAQWSANIAGYSAALAAAGPEADALRLSLGEDRARIESRLDALDAILRRDFPQYFALIRPEPLEPEAAARLLGPDEALLLVVPGEFGTHIIALAQDGMRWERSTLTTRGVAALVRRLLWDVGANVSVDAAQAEAWQREAGPDYGYDRSTAHELYGEIVAPVADLIAGKRHLFIAATGSLSSLPFGLLVSAAPQGRDDDPAALRATRWFADDHALIQIPSVQSLEFLRRFGDEEGERPQGFIGFGDPVLMGAGQARGSGRGGAGLRASLATGDLRQLRNLARLPGTAEELINMRAALGAPAESLFLADRATERNLRSIDLSGARILALATHGLLAGELRGAVEPGLVLTPPASPSAEDDGYLAASEIAALRLDADWVILSACNTAAGDGSAGAPGLSGLARAFFYAGARTLLASHWPVRDDVSARLTVRALEIQRTDPALSRAEAFQRAMREIREDAGQDATGESWAHPNAWAPFTLIGDGAR